MTDDTALAVQDAPSAPLTLFGTQDPADVVERASEVATALADVIKRRKLAAKIGGREHVLVEGWTLLGSMLGVFAEVEWSRPLDEGWEARAVAHTLDGRIVGAAEAMCTRDERTWKSRDDYALRSMAQTRAVGKALRLPLGFIVELAGYAATPAEELAIEPPSQASRVPPSPAKSAVPADPKPAAAELTPEQVEARYAFGERHGFSREQFEEEVVRVCKGQAIWELVPEDWRIFADLVKVGEVKPPDAVSAETQKRLERAKELAAQTRKEPRQTAPDPEPLTLGVDE